MKILLFLPRRDRGGSAFLCPDYPASYTEPHDRRGDQGIAIRLGTRRRRELVRNSRRSQMRMLISSSTVTISMLRSRRRSYRFPLHLYYWTDCALSPRGLQQRGLRSLGGSLGVIAAPIRCRLLQTGTDGDRTCGSPRIQTCQATAGTLSAAAPEDLIASSGGGRPGGAIYLFRRNGGTWRQRARLEPTIPPFIEGSNVMKVAMSADAKHRCARHAELLPPRNSTNKAVKCSCSISMARHGCARESGRLARPVWQMGGTQ